MRHQELLAGVATRLGASNDDARTGADAALAVVAARLPDDDRRALADALPTLLEQESGVDDPGSAPADGGALVEEVARLTGWPAERARYAIVAVTGELSAQDQDLGARIARSLPAELVGSGPTLPPDAASEGQQGRPQPVDADELERALRGLVDWSGDLSGIERTIELPSERLDLVLDRIEALQQELAHRPRVVERTPTSLTLRARTESLQVVTRLDLELAGRVDDVVAAIGAGG